MSSYDDIAMDFGGDDDTDDFLTDQLAALGIDEDLELSGGEEENEDPAAAAASPPPAAAASASSPERPSVPPPPAPERRSPADEGDWGQSPATAAEAADWGQAPQQPPISSAGKPKEKTPPRRSTAAGGGRGGGGGGEEEAGGEEVEDGELLELLDKPLQASRDSGRSGRDGDRGKAVGGKAKTNVTIRQCAKWVCQRLDEPKYYLMCRVVSTIGYRKTRGLLERVQQTQDAGGMPTADGSRKRTAGGVFFTLLKEHMEPAQLKELYADEIRVKKENDRAKRSANKRKAEALLAGEDVMTPRDPPRQRRRESSSNGVGGNRGGGGSTRAARDMGTWVGPGGP